METSDTGGGTLKPQAECTENDPSNEQGRGGGKLTNPVASSNGITESDPPEVKPPVDTVGNGDPPAESELGEKRSEPSEPENSEEPQENEEAYITPLEDPLDKASKYLSKHDILGFLQNITAGIAYKRPGAPLEFMVNEIEKIQEQERRRKGVITRKPNVKTSRKPEDAIAE